MSMWLPGGAGTSICSGARTTWRTYCATSQTSTTRARPHRLWFVAPTALQPAPHEAGGRLLAMLRHPAGHLGLHPRPGGLAVAGAALHPGVLCCGDGTERGCGVVGVLSVVPGVAALFVGDHARDDTTGPHAAGVDVEVVEVVARVGLDTALLGLQHHLVLEEDVRDALAEAGGDHLLVQAPVAGEGPEVEAGVVGLRGHGVDHRAGDALAAVALGRAGAG